MITRREDNLLVAKTRNLLHTSVLSANFKPTSLQTWRPDNILVIGTQLGATNRAQVEEAEHQ